MPWLRLIRWSNLLIIFLTQAVAWWCVIVPLQDEPGINVLLTPVNFMLLTVSTLLIAAAGYIINDYFDIRIDAINKPDEVILEKTIPRRMAIIVHSCMNVLALLLAGIVAWQAGHPEWLLLQLLCTGMLWRYSTHWKRQFITGNVVVALMTALTVIALIIFEPATRASFAQVPGWRQRFIAPAPVLMMFAVFAFLLTWMREIIKDIEDFGGDAAEGCLTMPIKWGILKSVRFVQALGLVTLLLIVYCSYYTWHEGVKITEPFLFCLNVIVLLPLLRWTIRIIKLRSKAQFTKASRSLKLIMVCGIIVLIFYRR